MLDLEVKDVRVIFRPIWDALEEEVGKENLRFPKEIILMGGAPGAGKGTHTRFIMQARGLTCPPIVMSELLTTPEMERLKAQGGIVGDKEAVSALVRELLKPIYHCILSITISFVSIRHSKQRQPLQQDWQQRLIPWNGLFL